MTDPCCHPQMPQFKCVDERNWGGSVELNRQDGDRPKTIIFPTQFSAQGSHVISVTMEAQVPSYSSYLVNSRYNVICELLWGVGGGNHFAEVDAKMGTVVSLPANSVGVNAKWPEDPTTAYPDKIVVQASVALGGRSGCQCPTRTYPRQLIEDGNSFLWPVAPFAKSVVIFESVLGQFTTLGAATVTLLGNFQAGSAPIAQYDGSTFAGTNEPDGVPVPGNARGLQIVNSAGQAFAVTVMYMIDL